MEGNDKKNFEEFFEELEDLIEQTMEDVEKSMRHLLKSDYEKALGRPRFYGFSVQMDERGLPKISKFGDNLTSQKDARTPFYDQLVDTNRRQLTLIFELPGIEKDSIQLKTSTDKLILDAKSEDREYHAEVDLEAEVDPSTSSCSFRNGLLTVSARIKEPDSEFTNISVI
jgi:HSP20 family protein